jgi:hypothetical protein
MVDNFDIVDGSRVGIMGWSHGGMITLMNLFNYPGQYKCGFAGVPVSDVIMRMGYASDSYRKIFSAKNHIGQTAKDNIAEYKRRSPVWHAEKLKDPLLIYTNTSDDDVNVVEVESMIRALKAEGKKFEYKIFERAPGATAINPYLALATIREMVNSGEIKGEDYPKAKKNYIKSVGDGLLKIFSKMGISTLMSYQGAQIFEIIGLNKLVVNTCFTGAISRIEGLGFDDLAEEALAKHFDAYAPKFEQPVLNEGGVYQWKRKGEYHMYNPQTVDLLQKATRNNDYETFKKYSRAANNLTNNAATLRSLLEFKNDRPAIPIEVVSFFGM